jgi:hypothetical protein
MTSLRYRSAAFTVTCLAAVLLQPMVAPAAAQPATGAQEASAAGRLDLGPADLVETRTVERLQPGVTLTVIRRGAPDPALSWTLEVRIPATAGAPDPAAPPRVLSDLVSAEAEAVRLRAAGLMPRVEAVAVPRAADVAPGVLGFRVRVGAFASRLEADAALSGLVAAGSTGSAVYTGWDGDRAARGPWTVRVLTVDPRASAALWSAPTDRTWSDARRPPSSRRVRRDCCCQWRLLRARPGFRCPGGPRRRRGVRRQAAV